MSLSLRSLLVCHISACVIVSLFSFFCLVAYSLCLHLLLLPSLLLSLLLLLCRRPWNSYNVVLCRKTVYVYPGVCWVGTWKERKATWSVWPPITPRSGERNVTERKKLRPLSTSSCGSDNAFVEHINWGQDDKAFTVTLVLLSKLPNYKNIKGFNYIWLINHDTIICHSFLSVNAVSIVSSTTGPTNKRCQLTYLEPGARNRGWRPRSYWYTW